MIHSADMKGATRHWRCELRHSRGRYSIFRFQMTRHVHLGGPLRLDIIANCIWNRMSTLKIYLYNHTTSMCQICFLLAPVNSHQLHALKLWSNCGTKAPPKAALHYVIVWRPTSVRCLFDSCFDLLVARSRLYLTTRKYSQLRKIPCSSQGFNFRWLRNTH